MVKYLLFVVFQPLPLATQAQVPALLLPQSPFQPPSEEKVKCVPFDRNRLVNLKDQQVKLNINNPNNNNINAYG